MNSSGRMTVSPYFSSLVPLLLPFLHPLLLKLCSQSYGFLKCVHPREIHWKEGAALAPWHAAGTGSSSCIPGVPLGTEKMALQTPEPKHTTGNSSLASVHSVLKVLLQLEAPWACLSLALLPQPWVFLSHLLPGSIFCLGASRMNTDSRGSLYSMYTPKVSFLVTLGAKSRLLSAWIYASFFFSWSEASPGSEPTILCHLWPPFDLL